MVENFLVQFVSAEVSFSLFAGRLAASFIFHSAVLATLVSIIFTFLYEDNQAGDEDAFAREPFILRFDCPTTVVQDLVLIPVHTKPEDTLKELDELHDVVEDIRKKWKNDNIMILGDFNADGRYLSKKKKEKIRICSPSYDWLIDDDVDTTASNNNDNTYDRIVVYGETMSNAIVPNSAKSFNFQQEFKLTDEEALSISDHYPVEVELKTRAGRQKRMAVPDGTETTSGEVQSQKKGRCEHHSRCHLVKVTEDKTQKNMKEIFLAINIKNILQ
uniref:Deoxyribonuclease gamma-like n=1 Tax=Pundamilia nyererei TaxID=303518 RepID=A0A3B4F0Y0_9CICH